MHLTARENRIDVAKLLLKHNAPINAQTVVCICTLSFSSFRLSVEGNLTIALVRPVEVRLVTLGFDGAIFWLPIYTLRFIGPVFLFKGKRHDKSGPYVYLRNRSQIGPTNRTLLIGLLKVCASFSTNEESRAVL